MRLLAVDLGASGGRVLSVALTSGASGRLDVSEVHRFPNTPVYLPHDRGRTLYWDAPYLWCEVLTGLRKAGHDHGAPASIGVDTWGVDFALLDRDGRLLQNPVAYRDGRTEGMLERAFELVGRPEIFRRTGIQF